MSGTKNLMLNTNKQIQLKFVIKNKAVKKSKPVIVGLVSISSNHKHCIPDVTKRPSQLIHHLLKRDLNSKEHLELKKYLARKNSTTVRVYIKAVGPSGDKKLTKK